MFIQDKVNINTLSKILKQDKVMKEIEVAATFSPHPEVDEDEARH